MTGQDRVIREGMEGKGKSRAGKGKKTRQGRTGQERVGQDRAGKERTGEGREGESYWSAAPACRIRQFGISLLFMVSISAYPEY